LFTNENHNKHVISALSCSRKSCDCSKMRYAQIVMGPAGSGKVVILSIF